MKRKELLWLTFNDSLTTGITDAIAKCVLEELPMEHIFPELNYHMMEAAVTDNHVFQLVKTVAKNFCKIRMFHLGREFSAKATGEKVRSKLTRLVVFKNQ